ncbi:molybdate ABC transporter substrate-binding protein [Aerosakkonemataceae cyanobacterium BLCC-F50]|uniref:Molybdate ABC transporter substrate-binding protein n=1 Tax=Floridaenema flaviceps BLCC-F50 TaxID=3153642 RepID=A0ABV4Y3M0_9CYAN
MTKRRVIAFIGWILAALILVVGIGVWNQKPIAAQGNSTIIVSAAASLKDALDEIKPLYQKANPNVTVNYNFGASGALLQQIENGAPADVFISAAQKQMNDLQQKNLIVPETRRNLLTNTVVLIAPKNSNTVTSFKGLTSPNIKRIAVGEPRSVPVGQYSEEIFKNLGILDQLKPKFTYGNSVRNVLAAVESGNADAGVVYATDAKISDQVKVVETAAANLHSPVVYPMAVLKNSKNAAAAKEYAQFLQSANARSIFTKYGFGIAK